MIRTRHIDFLLFLFLLCFFISSCGGGKSIKFNVYVPMNENCETSNQSGSDWESLLGQYMDNREIGCFYISITGNKSNTPVKTYIEQNTDNYGEEVILSRNVFDSKNIWIEPLSDETDYKMLFKVYDKSGNLMAYARNDHLIFDETNANIFLNPLDQFTCAYHETNENTIGEDNLRRAFHKSIKLPNGELLILGGVDRTTKDDGTILDLSSVKLEPIYLKLAREAYVYNPYSGKIYNISISNELENQNNFRRVFFELVYIGEVSQGVYRYKVIGGLTSLEDEPAIGISIHLNNDSQLDTGNWKVTENTFDKTYRIPLIPAANATGADVWELEYNSNTKEMRILEAELINGWDTNIIDNYLKGLVFFGFTQEGDNGIIAGGYKFSPDNEQAVPLYNVFPIQNNYLILQQNGGILASGNLKYQRLNPSVNILKSNNTIEYLVWGGYIHSVDHDSDQIPDAFDSCPWNSNNTCDTTNDYDSDTLTTDDPCPQFNTVFDSLNGDNICALDNNGATISGELITANNEVILLSKTTPDPDNGKIGEREWSSFHKSINLADNSVLLIDGLGNISGNLLQNKGGLRYLDTKYSDTDTTYNNLPSPIIAKIGENLQENISYYDINIGMDNTLKNTINNSTWTIFNSVTVLESPVDENITNEKNILIFGGALLNDTIITRQRIKKLFPNEKSAYATVDQNLNVTIKMIDPSDTPYSDNFNGPDYYRWGHTATALNDGSVLIWGGIAYKTYENNGEITKQSIEIVGIPERFAFSKLYNTQLTNGCPEGSDIESGVIFINNQNNQDGGIDITSDENLNDMSIDDSLSTDTNIDQSIIDNIITDTTMTDTTISDVSNTLDINN